MPRLRQVYWLFHSPKALFSRIDLLICKLITWLSGLCLNLYPVLSGENCVWLLIKVLSKWLERCIILISLAAWPTNCRFASQKASLNSTKTLRKRVNIVEMLKAFNFSHEFRGAWLDWLHHASEHVHQCWRSVHQIYYTMNGIACLLSILTGSGTHAITLNQLGRLYCWICWNKGDCLLHWDIYQPWQALHQKCV